MPDAPPHIGTLREAPLHASLKRWYARPGDAVEQEVDGFVIDLVRDDGLLIEIQTSGFSSMKKKVATLLNRGHQNRIVHPIPAVKTLVKVDDDGEVDRRISPKHGAPTDVFAELVSFPELMVGQRLQIDVLVTIEEEYRRHSPDGPWRRKGWAVTERRLVEVRESVLLSSAIDLIGMLPRDLPRTFTTADLAERLCTSRRLAQQMAYCLRKIGAIDVVGRRGRAIEYEHGET